MVSAGVADTASVEAVKELPALSVQKPPRGLGEKWFPDQFSAAPAAMVEIPAGLKTRPAWWQLDRLGGWRAAKPPRLGLADCCGVADSQAWHPQPCTP